MGAEVGMAILPAVGRDPLPTGLKVLAELPFIGAFTPPLLFLNMVKSFCGKIELKPKLTAVT